MQSDDASFWCKNRAKAETEARQYYQHEDVKKEEMRVKTNDFPEWEPAIVVRDLKKKFRKRIYNYVHSDSWGGALFFAAMPNSQQSSYVSIIVLGLMAVMSDLSSVVPK